MSCQVSGLKLIFVFTFLWWSHCGCNYYYYYYSYLITHLYCCTEWFHSIIFIILQYLVVKPKILQTNIIYTCFPCWISREFKGEKCWKFEEEIWGEMRRVSVWDSFSLYQGSQLKIRSVFSVYSDMSFVISDPGLYRRGLPSPPPTSYTLLQSDNVLRSERRRRSLNTKPKHKWIDHFVFPFICKENICRC